MSQSWALSYHYLTKAFEGILWAYDSTRGMSEGAGGMYSVPHWLQSGLKPFKFRSSLRKKVEPKRLHP